VIVAVTTPATAALQAETQTIPIVFAIVSDPVGSGFVASLARPGGNITGFINIEASLSGKWLELMREIAPEVSRVALMFNPQTAPYARYYLDTFQSASSALAVGPIEASVHGAADVEAVMAKLGREEHAGLVVADRKCSHRVRLSLAWAFRCRPDSQRRGRIARRRRKDVVTRTQRPRAGCGSEWIDDHASAALLRRCCGLREDNH
jgi:hypothetical protein